MVIIKWLEYVFLKIFTLGKKDIKKDKERKERLLKILMLLHGTSREDWVLERNVKMVKTTIYHEIYEGDDFITDGVFMAMHVPRYRIDTSREPIKIHETWSYFFNLDRGKGFMTFRSNDNDVFCKGEIVGVINSEIVVEKIYRGKTDVDSDLLGFFDSLRTHLKRRR